MLIFKVNIKRFLKDKLNLFFVIVFLVIIIVLLVVFVLNIELLYKVGIVVEEEDDILKIIKFEF